MPKRKALKGLSGIKIYEILENTETKYKVGEATNIPYAQKLTRDIQTSNDPIYADDEVYDDEEVFDGENFDLEVPEADLKLMAIFENGEYDEETKEYNFGANGEGKDYAMTFKAKMKNGLYRMFRYYRCKFKKAKQDLQTADNGTQISVVTISGTFYRRSLLETINGKIMQNVRTIKDAETIDDLKWLDTIPTVPTVEVEQEKALSQMTKDELLAKAAELGITNVSSSNNKDEIIAEIETKLAENETV